MGIPVLKAVITPAVFMAIAMLAPAYCFAVAPPPADPVAQARLLRNPTAVIALLEPWVEGTVGDPRVAEARGMVDRAYGDLAAGYQENRVADAAFDAMLRHAAFLDKTDTARGRARREAAAVYAGAAVRDATVPCETLDGVVRRYAAAFPERPALLSVEMLRARRQDELADAMRRGKLSSARAASQVRQLLTDDVDLAVLTGKGVPADAVLRRRAKDLADMGWVSESLAHAALVPDAVPLVQAGLTRLADSLNGTGSASLVRSVNGQGWLAEAEAGHAAAVKRFREGLDKRLAADVAPQSVSFAKPITARAEWTDNGGGLAVAGRVQVGTGNWPDGATARGELTVRAGVHVTGGTLRLHEGVLRFAGTPQAPIVVQNVKFETLGHGGARVEAVCTVFIACLLYIVCPIDLLPDFIPVVGWTDDLVALVTLIRAAIKPSLSGPQE